MSFVCLKSGKKVTVATMVGVTQGVVDDVREVSRG